jgi:hypothetical protein
MGRNMGCGTRRKMMLIIEDAKTDGPKKNVIEELNEMFDDTSKSLLKNPILFLSFASI